MFDVEILSKRLHVRIKSTMAGYKTCDWLEKTKFYYIIHERAVRSVTPSECHLAHTLLDTALKRVRHVSLTHH